MLGHRGGHSVTLAYDLPLPEIIKGQNSAQQMGSATSYAKRYCACSALNIVTGDDDDGSSAGTAVEVVSEQEATVLDELCLKAGALEAMLDWATQTSGRQVDSCANFPKSLFEKACKTLNKKIAQAEKNSDELPM
jgi:hypothetical protein